MRAIFLVCLLLSSCGRPLTPEEASFAARIHGDRLDTSRVKLVSGNLVGEFKVKRKKRPRLACRERIMPPPKGETVTVSAGGIALFNKIFIRENLFVSNYLHGYPDRMHLLAAMFFAHEMVHVWQWQEREKTGYHPMKAAAEHEPGEDPYLFDIATDRRFLDYPYEQQASIVEELVCCQALDPQAPRTKRLHALVSQALPVEKTLPPAKITKPWDDAPEAICH